MQERYVPVLLQQVRLSCRRESEVGMLCVLLKVRDTFYISNYMQNLDYIKFRKRRKIRSYLGGSDQPGGTI
jgi:hypothetical protein